MAKILDGRIVRDEIAKKLRSQISHLRPFDYAQGFGGQAKPKLVIIQIGDLEQANTYIRQKVLFGQKIGAIVDHHKFPENTTSENLKSKILNLNSDRKVTGIIVQLPLPKHLDKDKIIDTIDPAKDVDGQTSKNIKLLFESSPARHPGVATTTMGSGSLDSISPSGLQNDGTDFSGYVPATTRGILTLLDFYKIPVESKHVVIVGRSSLVGKPTALALINRDATVTICHSKTSHLSLITKTCNILIVAAGKPKLITKDHVSKGQVVVDVGINILEKSRGSTPTGVEPQLSKPEAEPSSRKLVGDVDFDSVKTVVAAISPVPGGCGPMTVASLFENLLLAYNRQT